MRYLDEILAAASDPRRLEELYQQARRDRALPAFQESLAAARAEATDNLLYAAWHYRLQPQLRTETTAAVRGAHWPLAIGLAVLAAVGFALLGAPTLVFPGGTPVMMILWAPLTVLPIMAYLVLNGGQSGTRALLSGAAIVILGLYATFWIFRQGLPPADYAPIMAIHLPLAAAIAVGAVVLGLRPSQDNLFAALTKAIEVLVTGGVFLIVGGMFTGIAIGMFAALNLRLSPEVMQRVFFAGLGAVPVLAVATVYDPRLQPIEQQFEQGLGKLVPIITRLLLPLVLIVLVIYLGLIPFRFMEPFNNREVLIVYNVMLFGVMGLLVGVTPVRGEDLPPRLQAALRFGITVLAALAFVISLYALSATAYRTALGGLTINRLTVIGWNVINIAILGLLLYRRYRDGAPAWVRSLQATAAVGIIGYVVWTAFLVLALPLIF